MSMSVAAQADTFGPSLASILASPLPYDSANPMKPALMLELMPPAGDASLLKKVWEPLSTAFTTTPQSTPFVLLVATSGVGKTKAAYDVGVRHAFVVLSRIVEHDSATPPWRAFFAFAHEVVRTSICKSDAELLPLPERFALKAALIVLLGAHLEWAVLVSEAALEEGCRLPLRLQQLRKPERPPQLCL
jgi:hypothetical protein